MAQYAASKPLHIGRELAEAGDQRVLVFAGCCGPAIADPDRGHPEGPIAGRPGPSAIPIEWDKQQRSGRQLTAPHPRGCPAESDSSIECYGTGRRKLCVISLSVGELTDLQWRLMQLAAKLC